MGEQRITDIQADILSMAASLVAESACELVGVHNYLHAVTGPHDGDDARPDTDDEICRYLEERDYSEIGKLSSKGSPRQKLIDARDLLDFLLGDI